MNTIKYITLAGAAIALSTSASAAEATGSAGATIIAPLAISNTAGLNFGTVAPGSESATVVLATDGTRTCAAALTCLDENHQAAAFAVTGQSSYSYDITVPASVTMTDGGSNSMTATLSGSKSSGTITDGTDSFTVGGTLTVAGSQAAGSYTGSFTVEVAYQ